MSRIGSGWAVHDLDIENLRAIWPLKLTLAPLVSEIVADSIGPFRVSTYSDTFEVPSVSIEIGVENWRATLAEPN